MLSESVLDQNGPNDHFGQNDLIPNRILAFTRPKWTKIVHFGPLWPQEVHFGPSRLVISKEHSRPFCGRETLWEAF